MGMTVPQKKYFCNRIDEISIRKENDIWNKVKEPKNEKAICLEGLDEGKIKLINQSQMEKLIRNNLKSSGPQYSHSYMPNINIESFFIGWESYLRKSSYINSTLRNEADEKVQKIREEATKIKDIAMFGNSAEAHIMLKEFVKWMQ
jgi:hypothetical protein|tara:strand:- start:21951 stop:22388 length:438 start_codon:yes stop_codon:yes gene_type:complete